MPERNTADLPSALEQMEEIARRLSGKRPALFLDYDGVLTPIVPRAGDARLATDMRSLLGRLASRCPVAVVSGRDLPDVRERVGLPGIAYAGSHGFDMEGAGGEPLELEEAEAFLPRLDTAEALLRKRLFSLPGVHVERKRFAVAIHYRQVAAGDVSAVEETVDAVRAEVVRLRKTGGKKVFELRPDLAWDKGRAVIFFLERFGCGRPLLPFYFGDDLTDEDAFRALQGKGISIIVRDSARPTFADYALESSEEVGDFLARLERLFPG